MADASMVRRRSFGAALATLVVALLAAACGPAANAGAGAPPAPPEAGAPTVGPTATAAAIPYVPPSAAKTAEATFALTPHPTPTATVVPTATPVGAAVPFAAVEKLLVGNCAGCHPPNQGLDLTAGHVYASIVNVPTREDPSLLRVKPGDPAASYLYLKVSLAKPPRGARMPLAGPPLSSDELTTLRAWIQQGAHGP
jgi:hypothetical protein